MATQVKHRRGTAAEIAAGTPAIGELWFNTTDNSIHMGDGVTQGGIKHLNENTVKDYFGFYSDVRFSNIDDMVSGLLSTGEGHTFSVGQVCSTPGTQWQVTAVSDPMVIGNFAALSRVHVKSFGAAGDGVTDDTVAINAAFAWLRDNATSSVWANQYEITGAGGLYRCDDSIDGTIIRGNSFNWAVYDLKIVSHAAGKTALDLTGCQYGKISNVYIWGDATNTPYNLLQIARHAESGTTGEMQLDHVAVNGYSTNAAYHIYGATRIRHLDCFFWNRQSPDGVSSEAWALICDGQGVKAALSDFITLPTGDFPMNGLTFDRCSIRKMPNTAESSSGAKDNSVIFTERYNGLNFNKCYASTQSGKLIEIGVSTLGQPRDLTLDFECEADDSVPFDPLIDVSGDSATIVLRGMKVSLYSVAGVENLIGSSATNSVTAYKLGIDIPQWQGLSPSSGIFVTPSDFDIYDADISLPNTSDMNSINNFASFQGRLFHYDADRPRIIGPIDIETPLSGGVISDALQVGKNTNNPISVAVSGSIRQITKGSNDSGGAGFSVLVVPN